MKGIKQFGAVLAVSAMFAASTFADSRPRNESDWRTSGRNDGRNDERYERRDDRRDDRGGRNLSAQGRVTSLHRERDGYRLQLDRGAQWYYVPAAAWRARNRGLSIGLTIRLGGGYRDDRGYIYVSDADYYEGGGYGHGRGDGWISGVVRRVDYRRNVLEIRDERTRRNITVDARAADRRNRRGIDVSDLQRGDFVELEGAWVRGNVFQAHRIDSVDSRRR